MFFVELRFDRCVFIVVDYGLKWAKRSKNISLSVPLCSHIPTCAEVERTWRTGGRICRSHPWVQNLHPAIGSTWIHPKFTINLWVMALLASWPCLGSPLSRGASLGARRRASTPGTGAKRLIQFGAADISSTAGQDAWDPKKWGRKTWPWSSTLPENGVGRWVKPLRIGDFQVLCWFTRGYILMGLSFISNKEMGLPFEYHHHQCYSI